MLYNENMIVKSKLFLLPLVVLLLGGIYFLLRRFAGLPEYKELIQVAQGLLNSHGLWIVGPAALIEGMLLVGNYLPGGLVIFLAVIAAGNDLAKISWLVLLICFGYVLANIFNYLLGRFGWYPLLVKFGLKNQLHKAEQKWTQQSLKAIFFSYWQANLAALTATAAGILKIDFRKFFKEALIGIVFWNIVFTLLVYIFREKAVFVVTNVYIIFGIFLLLAIYVSIKQYRPAKNHSNATDPWFVLLLRVWGSRKLSGLWFLLFR